MYVSQYVFAKNKYENVYKCCSHNIGKNWFYYGEQYQPNTINYDYNSSFHLRLKRKSYKKDEQYLDLLK
jgi:hypothetical protein